MKTKKVLAIIDKDGNKTRVPLYSTLADVNGQGLNFKRGIYNYFAAMLDENKDNIIPCVKITLKDKSVKYICGEKARQEQPGKEENQEEVLNIEYQYFIVLPADALQINTETFLTEEEFNDILDNDDALMGVDYDGENRNFEVRLLGTTKETLTTSGFKMSSNGAETLSSTGVTVLAGTMEDVKAQIDVSYIDEAHPYGLLVPVSEETYNDEQDEAFVADQETKGFIALLGGMSASDGSTLNFKRKDASASKRKEVILLVRYNNDPVNDTTVYGEV